MSDVDYRAMAEALHEAFGDIECPNCHSLIRECAYGRPCADCEAPRAAYIRNDPQGLLQIEEAMA